MYHQTEVMSGESAKWCVKLLHLKLENMMRNVEEYLKK